MSSDLCSRTVNFASRTVHFAKTAKLCRDCSSAFCSCCWAYEFLSQASLFWQFWPLGVKFSTARHHGWGRGQGLDMVTHLRHVFLGRKILIRMKLKTSFFLFSCTSLYKSLPGKPRGACEVCGKVVSQLWASFAKCADHKTVESMICFHICQCKLIREGWQEWSGLCNNMAIKEDQIGKDSLVWKRGKWCIYIII